LPLLSNKLFPPFKSRCPENVPIPNEPQIVVGETKMARNMENAYFQTEKIRQM
jgi:hypothetical protein